MKKYILYSMLCAILNSNSLEWVTIPTHIMGKILFYLNPVCYKQILTNTEKNHESLIEYIPDLHFPIDFRRLASTSKKMSDRVECWATFYLPLAVKKFYEELQNNGCQEMLMLLKRKEGLPLFCARFNYQFLYSESFAPYNLCASIKYVPKEKIYGLNLAIQSFDKAIIFERYKFFGYVEENKKWDKYFKMCFDQALTEGEKIKIEQWLFLFESTFKYDKEKNPILISEDVDTSYYQLESTVYFNKNLSFTFDLFLKLIKIKCFIDTKE